MKDLQFITQEDVNLILESDSIFEKITSVFRCDLMHHSKHVGYSIQGTLNGKNVGLCDGINSKPLHFKLEDEISCTKVLGHYTKLIKNRIKCIEHGDPCVNGCEGNISGICNEYPHSNQ